MQVKMINVAELANSARESVMQRWNGAEPPTMKSLESSRHDGTHQLSRETNFARELFEKRESKTIGRELPEVDGDTTFKTQRC